MFNQKSSDELVSLVETNYNETTRAKNQLSRILTIIQESIGQPVCPALIGWLKEVKSKNSLNKSSVIINALANKVEAELANKALADELRTVAEEALVMADTLPERELARNFLRDEQIVEYLDGLETSAQRVFSFLARQAGLTRTDILREVDNLANVKYGYVTIGDRTESGQPAARRVTFDASYINEKDLQEVVDFMAHKVLNPGGYGLSGDAVIGQHTHNLEFTLRDLRNSHAASLLMKGYAWSKVAEIQGVNLISFRDRMVKFLDANDINI